MIHLCAGDFKSGKSREIIRLLRLAGGKTSLRELRGSCENLDYSLKKLLKDGVVSLEESVASAEIDSLSRGKGRADLSTDRAGSSGLRPWN